MHKKLIRLIIILSVFLNSCTQINDSKTLRMNLGSEPLTLDWNLANDYISFDIISNLMVGLTRFGLDSNGNIISVPGCAESWTISKDSTEYIFKLNPEIKWTDGQPVIAQDFVDSFKRLLAPETAAPYAALLSMIDLEKTEAINDYTLKIKLKNPAAYFIYLTSYGLALPIRQDLINEYGKDWTEPENLVTNGPFKLSEWQHEYKIVLSRNENFKDWIATSPKAPRNDGTVLKLKYFMVPEQSSAFTLYQNNQLDWIDSRSIPLAEIPENPVIARSSKATTWQSPNGDTIQRIPLLRNTYVGFNNQSGPMKNPKLRKAFSYAIDRKVLTKVRSKGDEANSTFIPPSLSQYLNYEELIKNFERTYGIKTNKEEYLNGYYPDLAKQLLKEAGYKSPESVPELSFIVPNTESSKILAETLQSMWQKELGISVKISTLEWKVFLNTLRDSPPDLFRLNWGADYPDPDTFMQLFTSGNQINYEGFSDKQYDQLIKEAGQIQDLKKRQKLYTEAELILSQKEMAIAPLFIDSQIIMKKPYVKNLIVNPMDIVFLDKVKLGKKVKG